MADTEQANVDYADLIKAQTRQVDIDAFKERGMKKVNVINAKKINDLISQAVTNIISRMEDANIQTIKDDKAQIVMDSMSEFKRLFAEQKKEQEQQAALQEELAKLREQMTKQATAQAAAPAANSVQMQQVSDEIAELKAFMVNQASKAQSQEMTRAMMVEQQAQLLEDHFNELKATLSAGGGAAAAAVSEDSTRKAVEQAVSRMEELLEKQERNRNGATTDAIMKALQEFRADLSGKFDNLANSFRESVKARSEDDAKALKAEIAALRDDLAQKTVAASAANTEALQAQLNAMQEMLAKGGGGIGGGDLSELVSKIEGSLSKKLSDAGLMKAEVSAEEAVNVSSVMVNSAFRGLDDVESNLGNMEAAKQTDKEGGKKAAGALAALKKLKGK
ncbi:MAG: hypothetical protein HS108_03085 [Planctomycetes bacterium]|jgi:hypothetical protein|nr:hypothetical protein [Planctomycetota bacterium]